MSETDNPFAGAEIIAAYRRAEALDDGFLVDVSALAGEYGIRYPVALTRATYDEAVALPDHYSGCQDETGRIWDVLTMLKAAIGKPTNGPSDEVRFEVLVRAVNSDGSDSRRPPAIHRLWAKCGPGDDAEPVITVMNIGED